ncbi:hypothetical protein ACUN24_17585 [Pedobacter sp. WC2501]|uniref:hypothetical protein n=1 Tax=Pedobacter sp. WC2501 TaxID=3461400 RepID=UPI0040458B63
MKTIKLIIAINILLISISCNSQQRETSEFYVKYKANNTPYKILFLKPDESVYDIDSTTAIRKFEHLRDSVIIDNDKADFNFSFYKNSSPSKAKNIIFIIEKSFILAPKEYKVADFDLDKPISFEKRNNGYDGLAEYSMPNGRLYSWQYSWVKNHKPAKWTITKVDKATKTISGTFSFTATQADSDGNTDLSKKNTFLKVIEIDITEGEFHLPYSELKH